MQTTFDLTIAQSLYDSNDRFPVDFDLAWKWCGYTRKNNALAKLIADGFEEGLDYISAEKGAEKSHGNSSNYSLTVDCFKHFGMMAKTEQGKQIRRYFLQCEKSHKESAQTIAVLRTEIDRLKSLPHSNSSARVDRSGVEAKIQAIRCEMNRVKADLGMDYPDEAKLARDLMAKRLADICRKSMARLSKSFVSPGQLDLELPTALPTSTRSKAKGGN